MVRGPGPAEVFGIERRDGARIGPTMHLRLALRRLAATPTFTVAAVAVLALGSGATLAVFTVLNALVLKTLPVQDPGQLVGIEVRNARGEPSTMARPLFDAVSHRQRSLVQVTDGPLNSA